MKVSDLLTTAPVVNEEFLSERIKQADWKYEFSEDDRRQVRGERAMLDLERLVFEFWKKNPVRAVELWNTQSPCGARDKTVVPGFIFKLNRCH